MAYAISDIVRDSRGVPVSDALVYVYSPQGGLASLYNDLGAPISNPLATNDNGLFEGYSTEDGYHKLSIHYGGRERLTDEVLLGTEPIARAEGAATVLAAVNGGYWEDSATPPTDAVEGQDFYASFDGRAMLLRNVGGAGVVRWELTTLPGVTAEFADPSKGAGLVAYRSPLAQASTTTLFASFASRRANAKADFGAVFDGTTDDTIAIQRGINAIAAAGGGALELPAGVSRVGTLFVPQDVILTGQGKYMTRLQATPGLNAPVIDRSGTIDNIINRGGVQGLTIVGSGKAVANCIGIKLAFTNRGIYRDIDIFATREGMRVENVWQEVADNIHVHGGGTDQSYIGFRFMPRLAVTGISNAVIATGCMAQGVEAYGWRLENANGSKFSGCEGSDGIHAWYIGDPSSGTEAFEFCHFVNCLGDTTSSDIWRIERGNATSIRKGQYSNCWAGSSATGSAVRVGGASELVFSNWQTAETYQHGFHFLDSSRCSLTGSNVRNWNKESAGSCGVYVQNSSFITVTGSQLYSTTPGVGKGFVEAGTSDYNVVSSCNLSVGATIIGANSVPSANVSG